MTLVSSLSEVALGYVLGGLLGRHGRYMPREVDFEEPGCQEGPFHTQLWLSRHPMYVCVLGLDPEAPEEVERYNRTLMGAVRCYVDKAQNSWDEHLAQIAGALRSAVNRNSGFTANKLMLGQEVNTPADLLYPAPKQGDTVDLEAYMVELEQALQTAHDTARGLLCTSEERMKRDYD